MATLLGAGALAVLAPLAVSWYSAQKSTDSEEWDASEFVIRGAPVAQRTAESAAEEKPPVMLNQQRQQQQQQQQQQHRQPSAAVQMTRQQKKHAIVAAAMHNVSATGYGGASVLLNTVKEEESDEDNDKDLMFAGDSNFQPDKRGDSQSSNAMGLNNMHVKVKKDIKIDLPLNKAARIDAELWLAGGKSLFKEGQKISVQKIGTETVTAMATIHWLDEKNNTGYLMLQPGLIWNGASKWNQLELPTGTQINVDVNYETPNNSFFDYDATSRGATKTYTRGSTTNTLLEHMKSNAAEAAKDVEGIVSRQSRQKYQAAMESTYGQTGGYTHAPPTMEKADITCRQASRIVRDGFQTRNGSASWQNQNPAMDSGMDMHTRSSVLTRILNRGGDQSVKAQRLTADPHAPLKNNTHSHIGRNPARAYAPGNTTFNRAAADVDTAMRVRSNPVHRDTRNEVPGTKHAARPDAFRMRGGIEKHTNVDSAARVQGDRVQLRRMPNEGGKQVLFNVTDFQHSDRTLKRRKELPVQASQMPRSITTSDMGRRTERGPRMKRPFAGKQKSVVRLRRLNTVPGLMINRLNNDGLVVKTHALQHGSKGQFKRRDELGDDDEHNNVLPQKGLRARLAKNAEFARKNRRPELVDRGEKSVHAAQQSSDEFARRDVARPYQDNKIVHHSAQGTVATRLARNEAWASEGVDARSDKFTNLRMDKDGTATNVENANAFEYEERMPNQQTNLPDNRTTTESSYVARFRQDNTAEISNSAQARRVAARESDGIMDLELSRPTVKGSERSIDQTHVVGIQAAGNAQLVGMASLGDSARGATLTRAERHTDASVENTRIVEDVADVQGTLKFVRPTEGRHRIGVPTEETTVRPGGWDSMALNHSLEGRFRNILPRSDPYMEDVPSGPFSQGFMMENETPDINPETKETFSPSVRVPTNIRPPTNGNESDIRDLRHVFRTRD